MALNENAIPKAISGDRSAQEQLLLEHYDRLVLRIRRKLGGRLAEKYSAEDILQESLVLAIRDFPACRANTQAEFGAWINSVVDHRMQDIRRHLSSRKRGGDRHEIAMPANAQTSMISLLQMLGDGDQSPSSRVATADAIKALQVGIAALPEDQLEAIERRVLAGGSLERVAEDMKKTPAAVRSLIHRAKQALRNTMGQSTRWFHRK